MKITLTEAINAHQKGNFKEALLSFEKKMEFYAQKMEFEKAQWIKDKIKDRKSHLKNKNSESNIAHEATTSKISEEQLHYCQQRGLNPEEAVGLIVNGFCKEVLQQLPMEFAVEAQKLVGISLEGSVG